MLRNYNQNMKILHGIKSEAKNFVRTRNNNKNINTSITL